AVSDALAPATVESITRALARGLPGHLGSGDVFVMQLDGCVRVPDTQAVARWGRRSRGRARAASHGSSFPHSLARETLCESHRLRPFTSPCPPRSMAAPSASSPI